MTTNLSLSAYKGLIEFFTVDLTEIGGPVLNVCNSQLDRETLLDVPPSITWGSVTYIALPFDSAGWKRGGDRAERPEIAVPDPSRDMYLQLEQLGGATGCPVIRVQAMAKDVEANNVNGAISSEKYVLNSVGWAKYQLKLGLATPFDFTGTKFPSFICTRETRPGLGSALLR